VLTAIAMCGKTSKPISMKLGVMIGLANKNK